MPIIHTTSQLVSPAGRISLDPYDAQGLLTGQIEFGHVPSATVSIEQDKNEEYSGESASRELIGTLYGRINRTMQIVCRNLSMEWVEIDRERVECPISMENSNKVGLPVVRITLYLFKG